MTIFLEITSFIGISLGASHYYGKIVGDVDDKYAKVDLKRTLTTAGAAELTERHGDDYTYRAGQSVEGFDTKEEIIALAKATYKDHFPGAKVLVLGRYVYGGPHPVLDGPDGLAEAVAELIVLAEKIGWWENPHNDAAMKTISRQYDALIKAIA
jgi:hypothetical protein